MLHAVFDDNYSLIAIFKMSDTEWQVLLAKWREVSGHPGTPKALWSARQWHDRADALDTLREKYPGDGFGTLPENVFVEWAKTQGVVFLPYNELTQF